MRRIIYLCHDDDKPSGGIKVIYRHAELLSDLGADAYVMHPFKLDFRCTWFDHHVRSLRSGDLHPADDFVIIPEIWAASFGPDCIEQGLRFAIFVQNGYHAHPLLPQQTYDMFDRVYEAADFVLSISEDTTHMMELNYPRLDLARVVPMRYSVHERFLAGDGAARAAGKATISYMPRKLDDHVLRVVFGLRQQLRRHPPLRPWQLVPIRDASETAVAEILRASHIFLSFSEFEGLPLPPLEAAIAGNVVVGYTGQGAREYWQAPNFHEVNQGDIRGFVTAACEAVWQIDTKRLTPADLAPGASRLAERYSLAAETANLRTLLDRIEGCFEGAPRSASLAETV